MKLHKVLITGSRDWKDRDALREVIFKEKAVSEARGETLMVIHGDHRTGADALADLICVVAGIHTARVGARWVKFGPGAGPLRNGLMVAMEPAVCYAFPLASSSLSPSGSAAVSKGTWDCVRKAREAGVQTFVYPFNEEASQ